MGLLWELIFASNLPGGIAEFDFGQMSTIAPIFALGAVLIAVTAGGVACTSGLAFDLIDDVFPVDASLRATYNWAIVRFYVVLIVLCAIGISWDSAAKWPVTLDRWDSGIFIAAIIVVVVAYLSSQRTFRSEWLRRIAFPAFMTALSWFVVVLNISYGHPAFGVSHAIILLSWLSAFRWLVSAKLLGPPRFAVGAVFMAMASVLAVAAIYSESGKLGPLVSLPFDFLGMGQRSVIFVVPAGDVQQLDLLASVCPNGIKKVGTAPRYWMSVRASLGSRVVIDCQRPREAIYLTIGGAWDQELPLSGKWASPSPVQGPGGGPPH